MPSRRDLIQELHRVAALPPNWAEPRSRRRPPCARTFRGVVIASAPDSGCGRGAHRRSAAASRSGGSAHGRSGDADDRELQADDLNEAGADGSRAPRRAHRSLGTAWSTPRVRLQDLDPLSPAPERIRSRGCAGNAPVRASANRSPAGPSGGISCLRAGTRACALDLQDRQAGGIVAGSVAVGSRRAQTAAKPD